VDRPPRTPRARRMPNRKADPDVRPIQAIQKMIQTADQLYADLMADTVAFPILSATELEECAEFGTRCSFATGEDLFPAGAQPFDCYVILSGEVCIIDVSTDEPTHLIRLRGGQFTGDIDLFTGRRAVGSCQAATVVEAIRIAPDKVREMLVRQPTLGARIWRAFQRRRELLMATDFQGIRVYGAKDDKQTLETVELLFRNGVPHHWMNIAEEQNATRLREIAGSEPRYPVIIWGKKLLFQAPGLSQLAEHIGLRHHFLEKTYDVVVLGSGPSGLGAAICASSEGLSTLVLDELGPGGQAVASSKIENYAGFPNGATGRELAQLSYLQALKFGAEFVAPCHVTELKREDDLYQVRTSEGDVAVSKTVIIATGVSYRLLDMEGSNNLPASGIYYNATAVEARMCKNWPVHVIGGGNSAGQAAMFLTQYARKVTLVVRGSDLRKSMSSYLCDRVAANPEIEVRYHTQVTAIEGTEHIRAVHLRDDVGNVAREETTGVFIFIGARPRTDFLPAEVARDDKGFVLTGSAVAKLERWKERRLPEALETSLPGVFASGDCRSGTTKRVAFAIGDGALAVSCVHNLLGTYPV
jgi:thioredoxin reductase (NADPH)